MPFDAQAVPCLPCIGDPSEIQFPVLPQVCNCDVAEGGISELYFIPCSVPNGFTQANMTDIATWQALVGANNLGRTGEIVGSIAKVSDTKQRTSSCKDERITTMTWGLTAKIYCFDKTSANTTCLQMNELITKHKNYLVVARMCDGENTILPIGRVNLADYNWTVPETYEELQYVEFQLTWKYFGQPCVVEVANLSSVVAKP